VALAHLALLRAVCKVQAGPPQLAVSSRVPSLEFWRAIFFPRPQSAVAAVGRVGLLRHRRQDFINNAEGIRTCLRQLQPLANTLWTLVCLGRSMSRGGERPTGGGPSATARSTTLWWSNGKGHCVFLAFIWHCIWNHELRRSSMAIQDAGGGSCMRHAPVSRSAREAPCMQEPSRWCRPEVASDERPLPLLAARAGRECAVPSGIDCMVAQQGSVVSSCTYGSRVVDRLPVPN
jgi:hypothetical protein